MAPHFRFNFKGKMNTLSGHTKNLKAARNSAKARVEAARKIQTAYRAALARRRRAAAAKVAAAKARRKQWRRKRTRAHMVQTKAARKIQGAYRAALARRRERVWRLMRDLHVLLARGGKIITRAFTKFKRYEWTRVLMNDMVKDSYEILVWASSDVSRVMLASSSLDKDLATILTAHTYLQLRLMGRVQEEARGLPPKKQEFIKQLRRDYSAIATKFRGILPVLGRSYPHIPSFNKKMSDSTRKSLVRTLSRYGKRRGIRYRLWAELFKSSQATSSISRHF